MSNYNFSYKGLTALSEWLEESAYDTSTPYELDVVQHQLREG